MDRQGPDPSRGGSSCPSGPAKKSPSHWGAPENMFGFRSHPSGPVQAGQTPGPSFPQMAGLISAAEMMMKAGNLRGGHPVGASPARMAVHWPLKDRDQPGGVRV